MFKENLFIHLKMFKMCKFFLYIQLFKGILVFIPSIVSFITII